MRKLESDSLAQHLFSSHAAINNTFGIQAHLTSRRGLRILLAQAHAVWTEATKAA